MGVHRCHLTRYAGCVWSAVALRPAWRNKNVTVNVLYWSPSLDDQFSCGRSVVVSLSQTPATFKTHLRYRHESEVVGHPMRWPYPRLEAIVSGVIIDVTRQLLTDVHDLAQRSPFKVRKHSATGVANRLTQINRGLNSLTCVLSYT